MANLLRCKSSFYRLLNGQQVMVCSGDIVFADDPVVAGMENCFESLDSAVKVFGKRKVGPLVIEAASASPGEKRVTPPRVTRSKKNDGDEK